MTPERPNSVSRLRASDADREAVVEQLQEAAAEGRIDLDELDTRLGQALGAKTFAELEPLTADLAPAPQNATEPLVIEGGMHGLARTGRWKVPARIDVAGGMGGAKLDFTQTETRLREIELEVNGQMGGVVVVVPKGWAAETDDVRPGLGGLKDRTRGERLPGAPLLRLTGSGGMGGVVVRHPNIWERWKLRRGKRR
ncbi:DUF1707 SHOCT-like domain-containing protein [Streptomyces sp. NBC_01320]|uniref:DUF1707 SHOCT-like domain-containing protein n=1 Tax=Streptomyces sp. NBC_01320 TaxID=2903824 RepID=UPI002E0E8DCC|nr:DUF1707 domain-containing protein [Streptomyces sp. NBC_01320]